MQAGTQAAESVQIMFGNWKSLHFALETNKEPSMADVLERGNLRQTKDQPLIHQAQENNFEQRDLAAASVPRGYCDWAGEDWSEEPRLLFTMCQGEVMSNYTTGGVEASVDIWVRCFTCIMIYSPSLFYSFRHILLSSIQLEHLFEIFNVFILKVQHFHFWYFYVQIQMWTNGWPTLSVKAIFVIPYLTYTYLSEDEGRSWTWVITVHQH